MTRRSPHVLLALEFLKIDRAVRKEGLGTWLYFADETQEWRRVTIADLEDLGRRLERAEDLEYHGAEPGTVGPDAYSDWLAEGHGVPVGEDAARDHLEVAVQDVTLSGLTSTPGAVDALVRLPDGTVGEVTLCPDEQDPHWLCRWGDSIDMWAPWQIVDAVNRSENKSELISAMEQAVTEAAHKAGLVGDRW